MRNITTILRGLQDKPQLVTETYANSVLEALESKDLSMFKGGDQDLRVTPVGELEASSSKQSSNMAALLEVDGGLTYKPAPCSGLTSYVQIKEAFAEVIEAGYKIVGFDMSSPGGQAYRCFATARAIRKMADDNGVRIVSYVDGLAASAGYALVAISDEIISNPMSSVGSIGAIVSIRNDLPKEIADGKERLFISDKGNKSPFEENGQIKEEVISKIQTEVTSLGKEFDTHVHTFRGISIESIEKMNAESFTAQEALSLGLIDKVMEREEFFSYLSDILNETNTQENVKLEDDIPTQADLEAVQALAAKQTDQIATLQAELTEATEKAAKFGETLEAVLSQRQAEASLALAESLSGYSFISDAKGMAELMEKLGEEDQAVLTATFEAVKETLAANELKQEEDTLDLFEMTSLQADGEDGVDVFTEASKLLAKKHNQGDK